MTVTQIIILAIIGLMAGIFSGTLGVGGAIIVIPALIFFLVISGCTPKLSFAVSFRLRRELSRTLTDRFAIHANDFSHRLL